MTMSNNAFNVGDRFYDLRDERAYCVSAAEPDGAFVAVAIADPRRTKVFSRADYKCLNGFSGAPIMDIDMRPLLGRKVNLELREGAKRTGVIVTDIEWRIINFNGKLDSIPAYLVLEHDHTDRINFNDIRCLSMVG